MTNINRRYLLAAAASLGAGTAWLAAGPAWAAEAPDDMIRRLSGEVLDLIRSDQALQRGDLKRIKQVVDSEIMPHVNFTRMTASAVGPAWRQASAEQRTELQEQFKLLLIHTYAGALEEVGDQTVDVLPLRAAPDDREVTVRTLVKGMGEPIQVDYRMEQDGDKWRIYDLNVLGVWMVANYRTQFRQQINADGVDGLIQALRKRNQANAG